MEPGLHCFLSTVPLNALGIHKFYMVFWYRNSFEEPYHWWSPRLRTWNNFWGKNWSLPINTQQQFFFGTMPKTQTDRCYLSVDSMNTTGICLTLDLFSFLEQMISFLLSPSFLPLLFLEMVLRCIIRLMAYENTHCSWEFPKI